MLTESCAGCHGIGGTGGVVIGGYAPPLGEASPTEVDEAVRVGPYLMPRFSEAQITPADLDSIARYVSSPLGGRRAHHRGWVQATRS